jgi:hypothetical protein
VLDIVLMVWVGLGSISARKQKATMLLECAAWRWREPLVEDEKGRNHV